MEIVEFRVPPCRALRCKRPGERPRHPPLTFAVNGLDASLARLRPHGAELVGETERYEDIYRLCYIRGPAGIINELAEPLG